MARSAAVENTPCGWVVRPGSSRAITPPHGHAVNTLHFGHVRRRIGRGVTGLEKAMMGLGLHRIYRPGGLQTRHSIWYFDVGIWKMALSLLGVLPLLSRKRPDDHSRSEAGQATGRRKKVMKQAICNSRIG